MICFAGTAQATSVCNTFNQTIYEDLQNRKIEKLLRCYLKARDQDDNTANFSAYQMAVNEAEAECETQDFVTEKLIQKTRCFELDLKIKNAGQSEALTAEREVMGCL